MSCYLKTLLSDTVKCYKLLRFRMLTATPPGRLGVTVSRLTPPAPLLWTHLHVQRPQACHCHGMNISYYSAISYSQLCIVCVRYFVFTYRNACDSPRVEFPVSVCPPVAARTLFRLGDKRTDRPSHATKSSARLIRRTLLFTGTCVLPPYYGG